jgi:diacylglycerol O-acyltransferase
MEIPTGIPDQMQRLLHLQTQLKELKKSSIPALNYLTLFLIGLLPMSLMSFILKDAPSSILFSSLPGPNCDTTFIDQKTCFPLFEGGFGKGDIGMGVSMLSYDGGVAISILPDEAIFPEKMEAEAFLRCIVNEIQLLHDSSIV